MKLVVIALTFLLAVATAQQGCPYSFSTDDGYSYTINDGWFNVTDQNGVDWFFSVCPTIEDSPCGLDNGEVVSVCQVVKEIPIPKGHGDTFTVSPSPDGTSRGLEVLYGLESEVPIKTVIELVCSYTNQNQEYTKIELVDKSMTVITVSSPSNCPASAQIYDDMMIDEPSTQIVVVHSGAIIYFLFLCISLISVCCCCTCLLRRKRSQQRKDIQMKQFSSVAFQPIPANKTAAPAQQAPSYNPYIAQPQFVYYYPSQNGATQEFTFPQYTENVEPAQTQSDEAVARNLQAQFDQEHV